jgi:hypothetical protein
MWIPDDTVIHVFKNKDKKPETEMTSNGVHKKQN